MLSFNTIMGQINEMS